MLRLARDLDFGGAAGLGNTCRMADEPVPETLAARRFRDAEPQQLPDARIALWRLQKIPAEDGIARLGDAHQPRDFFSALAGRLQAKQLPWDLVMARANDLQSFGKHWQ